MSSNTPFLQNLDTTFVNLWSLLRKLTQQGFVGRVQVEWPDYSADIFLDGSSTPFVREVDRAANTETIEQGALHRVVLRARETPGIINVFSGIEEATVPQTSAAVSESPASLEPPPPSVVDTFHEVPPPEVLPIEVLPDEIPPVETKIETAPSLMAAEAAPPLNTPEDVYRSGSYQDWPAILGVTGELIGAVERGINAVGGDFASLFDAARLELADDYVFLDPIARTFIYSEGVASLKQGPDVSVFVAGLSEALRRTINLVAFGDRARRARERIALEMLPVARRRIDVLERSGLRAQLDRIAGTVVM
jgi:hypothetical protein